MPRPKKEHYTWLPDKKLYRKKIKDSDGKYVCLYGKTEDELREKKEYAEKAVSAALELRGNPTFAQYAEQWEALNLCHVSDHTRANYEYIIRDYLTKPLGDKRMRDVTTDDCRGAMAAIAGKSKSACEKALRLLKSIFESAEDSRLIASNPARKLKAGGVKTKEKVALTDDQRETLEDAVKGTAVETFAAIGLYAGLRREEILGLKWDCVHLEGKTPYLSVRRAVRWVHNQPELSDLLKSDAARRDIPIPPTLVSCLKQEKQRNKSEFVICNKAGGAKTETQFKNMWHAVEARSVGTYKGMKDGKRAVIEKKLGEKCPCHNYRYTIDFEVTPHLLRHTYITNLILSGVNIKTVQYLAGHADPEMTLRIYTHLMQHQPKDTMQEIMKAYA